MQSLMDWQHTIDPRILRQEQWQKGAQSTITQMVSQSRFDSFFASRRLPGGYRPPGRPAYARPLSP